MKPPLHVDEEKSVNVGSNTFPQPLSLISLQKSINTPRFNTHIVRGMLTMVMLFCICMFLIMSYGDNFSREC